MVVHIEFVEEIHGRRNWSDCHVYRCSTEKMTRSILLVDKCQMDSDSFFEQLGTLFGGEVSNKQEIVDDCVNKTW